MAFGLKEKAEELLQNKPASQKKKQASSLRSRKSLKERALAKLEELEEESKKTRKKFERSYRAASHIPATKTEQVDRGGASKIDTKSGTPNFSNQPKKTVKLSYRAHEIIPRNSPYGFHFRALLNAERFVSEHELQMALDIYQRLINKIPSRKITDKIKKNIKDIEDFIEEEDQSPQPVMIQIVGAIPSPQQPIPIAPQQASLEGGGFAAGSQSTDAAGNQGHEESSHNPFGADLTGLAEEKARQKRQGEFEQLAEGLLEISKAMFQGHDITIHTEKGITIEGDIHTGGKEGTENQEKGGSSTGSEGGTGEQGKEENAAARESSSTDGKGDQGGSAQEDSDLSEAKENPPEKADETGVLQEPSSIPPIGGSGGGGVGEEEESEAEEENPPVQEIRGVLELKTPEQEDTPFLTLTYDFTKIPHEFALSKDHNILEYAYYKYKPMLVKAQKFIRRKQITKALNYYRTIREQHIPPEFREMIDRNIKDITEYIQKYLMTRQEVS